MSNNDGVPSSFVDNEREISGTFRIASDSNNTWKTVSFILGLIVAGGTVFSILGKAFYVTRTEYTDKVLSDSVERTAVQKTLESVNKSLANLEISVKDLSTYVEALKTPHTESLRIDREPRRRGDR